MRPFVMCALRTAMCLLNHVDRRRGRMMWYGGLNIKMMWLLCLFRILSPRTVEEEMATHEEYEDGLPMSYTRERHE